MNLLRYAFTILIFIHSLVSARPNDKFTKYYSIAKSSGTLELDDSAFEELTSAPRDYYVGIVLTARDSRYGCTLCRHLQTEWDILAKSWNKAWIDDSPKLLFGTLDFDEGRATFQKLMLQTAPILLLYSPTLGKFAAVQDSPSRYDFTTPLSADQIYHLLSRSLPEGKPLHIRRPVNYGRIVSVTTSVLGAIALFTVLAPYLSPVLKNRNLWASLSFITILLFTSGHMFNHIRQVPYIAGNGRGGITYFTGGFSTQLGLESQVVAATYAVLSFATIALAYKIPRVGNEKTQQFGTIFWAILLFTMYSFLLNIFRVKSGGYPFFLPPF